MRTALMILLLLIGGFQDDAVVFDDWFTGETMRVDLYRSGDATENFYSFDEAIVEGPWPGTTTKLIDTTNLGHYLLSVYDADSKKLLYSRGFSSLFGEWITTDEARQRKRTIGETMRFPRPKGTFELAISDRTAQNDWVEIYRVAVDPNYHTVKQEKRFTGFKVIDLHVPAEPRRVYDVLILPDGYAADDLTKLHLDLQHAADTLLNTKPYSEMKDKIAVRAIEAISRDSGPDEPRKGVWKDTLFGCGFNAFDLSRYVLTFENKVIHDVAANAPYDALLIMFNSERYGGGGIFNLYATFAGDNEWTGYLLTHEGGHSFCGLGDEYYTSDVAYNEFYPRGVEPWEPNITALPDPANVKWAEYLTEGVPIPTPGEEQYKDAVGAFEGAGYSAKGLYRPMMDCKMFSRKNIDYCPVCMAAVRSLLEFYTEE